MNGAALEARNLRVDLDTTTVVRDVDLVLPAGRWTAIVGPNGAGKTTLVKALAQLLPHQGQVFLLGRDAKTWSHQERARASAWLGQNVPQGDCAHSATHRALEQVFDYRIKVHSLASQWVALPN